MSNTYRERRYTKLEIDVIRKKKIGQIKIAQNQLGLDDDTYRALLTRITTKNSCAKLNLAELNLVVDELVRQGFVVRKNPRKPNPKLALTAMIDKIEALLLDNNLPWAYAHAISKRQFKVDQCHWLDTSQLHSVVAALQIYANRQKTKGGA